jgi:hypothetical protein
MEVSGQLHATVTLPPGEKASDTHRLGGWTGGRAGLAAMKERKTFRIPGKEIRQSNP